METLDEIAIGITPHAVTILNARRNKILRHIHPPEVRYIVHTDTEEGREPIAWSTRNVLQYSISYLSKTASASSPPFFSVMILILIRRRRQVVVRDDRLDKNGQWRRRRQ